MGTKRTKRKATAPATLRDRCLSHFDILRIPITPEALDEALLCAEKEALPYLDFLDRVLGEQAGAGNVRLNVVSATLTSRSSERWKLLTGTSTRRRSTVSRSNSWPRASSSNAGRT